MHVDSQGQSVALSDKCTMFSLREFLVASTCKKLGLIAFKEWFPAQVSVHDDNGITLGVFNFIKKMVSLGYGRLEPDMTKMPQRWR